MPSEIYYCTRCGFNTTNKDKVCDACLICDGPQGYMFEIFPYVMKRQKRFRETEMYQLMMNEVLDVIKPNPVAAHG